jgi:hypothetical protein
VTTLTDIVAPGNILTASNTATLTNKTISGANNTLTVRMASDVSGTLPIANGGTGLTALGTAGQVLTVNAGATALEFASGGGGAGDVTLDGVQTLTNKTLTAPILGTPTSVTLTNATGLPTAGLLDDAVTYAKIQNVTTAKLLGRATAESGSVEEITLGTNLSFTGTTLNAAGGGGGSSLVTIYENVAALPSSNISAGQLAFVTDVGRLFIYNAAGAWINTAPSTKNFFYLIQSGSFSGPITGTVEYVPLSTIVLRSLEASLPTASGTNIVIAVQKNGSLLQEFTLTAGSTLLEADFTNNSITTSDDITLNIVSGSGTDLAVRFIYT